jgi:DNA phosphorothioation-dependent restriction protein DptG
MDYIVYCCRYSSRDNFIILDLQSKSRETARKRFLGKRQINGFKLFPAIPTVNFLNHLGSGIHKNGRLAKGIQKMQYIEQISIDILVNADGVTSCGIHSKVNPLCGDLSFTMADTADNIDTAEGAEGTSKNALKKAAKAEEAAKKKAAKDEERKAKKASEPEKQAKVGGEDAEELDPTQYYENRIKAITNMEVTNPHRFPLQ